MIVVLVASYLVGWKADGDETRGLQFFFNQM